MVHFAICGAASGEGIAALESRLMGSILAAVNEANPVDPATGQRKFISVGFITDIHKCKRALGDDFDVNPATGLWYASAGVLTEAEPTIRLLGAVAAKTGLDAVINGGDFSTAPVIGDGARLGLTEAEYTNEIWNVKAMFDRHLPPGLPRFTIDGNHERRYTRNGAEMHLSDEAWAFVLTNFNTSAADAQAKGVGITYHRDIPCATLGDGRTGAFKGNSYHLDLRRLVATGGPNVRIACVSMYDSATGADPACRAYDAARFHDESGCLLDAALSPGNTVMGMVAHGTEERLAGTTARSAAGTLQRGFMNGYTNPAAKTGPWNHGAKGLGFIGLIAGHLHYASTKDILDAFDESANPGNAVHASAVSVTSAYGVNCPARPGRNELGTERAYHFSIFVIDTDRKLLREIRVGGVSQSGLREMPVVQLHDTGIRTALE